MGKVFARFSDQNGAKTLPFGAAHTVMACIREYPPGLDQKSENYAALEHGFPLVAFNFHTAKRKSFRSVQMLIKTKKIQPTNHTNKEANRRYA